MEAGPYGTQGVSRGRNEALPGSGTRVSQGMERGNYTRRGEQQRAVLAATPPGAGLGARGSLQGNDVWARCLGTGEERRERRAVLLRLPERQAGAPHTPGTGSLPPQASGPLPSRMFLGMWDFPRPGIKLVSPALAGGFFTLSQQGSRNAGFLSTQICCIHSFTHSFIHSRSIY